MGVTLSEVSAAKLAYGRPGSDRHGHAKILLT